jgi:hypothetical protein
MPTSTPSVRHCRSIDVSQAKTLKANAKKGGCFQGQTHGHKAFLLEPNDAKLRLLDHPEYSDVLFPFLIADDMIGEKNAKPTRFVIDFQGKDLVEARSYGELFKRVQKLVLPDREAAAAEENARNEEALKDNPKAKINKHHANFLKKWWVLSYPREDLIKALSSLARYVVCGRVTKRPIFEFVATRIRPNDALQVFPYADDYSFGVLQSTIHWSWFVARCSTLKSDYRYTSNTVFDSFPWPQKPSLAEVKAVAETARALRNKRTELRAKYHLSFRELYRTLELPGDHPLKTVHKALDEAVSRAYGMNLNDDALAFLLALNGELADAESADQQIQGPGLPAFVNDEDQFVTNDCIRP